MSDLDLDKIQKYLDGQLSEQDRKDFEDRLADDSVLAGEVRVYQELDLALEGAGADAFRSEIDQWEKASTTEKKIVPLRRFLSIAAALVLLVAASLFILLPSGQSAQEIFATYYDPYEDLITARDSKSSAVLNQAMAAYNQEEFATAESQLRAYLDAGGEHLGAKLYLAISQLEQGKINEVIPNLNALLNHPQYGQQSRWYLGLAYLKDGKITEAREILSSIAEDNQHYQQEKAQDILKRLPED